MTKFSEQEKIGKAEEWPDTAGNNRSRKERKEAATSRTTRPKLFKRSSKRD